MTYKYHTTREIGIILAIFVTLIVVTTTFIILWVDYTIKGLSYEYALQTAERCVKAGQLPIIERSWMNGAIMSVSCAPEE